MYDLPKDSLQSLLSNPLFDKVDMSDIPVSVLANQAEIFQKKNQMTRPETDALSFYFLSHLSHLLKSKFGLLEALPEDVLDLSQSSIVSTNETAKRLFFYSIIIAVEEARFIPSQEQKFFDHLENRFGKEFSQYIKNHCPGRLTDFGKLDMTAADYTQGMTTVFSFGKWQPGFGGRGWTPIAALVADCVRGNISIDQMADQAFSLCHNNGSMFNKGHMYHHYTQDLYKLLDIQDSGQIPQWIGQNLKSSFVSNELKNLYQKAVAIFPEELSGPLNMSLVKNSQSKREAKQKAQAQMLQNAWTNQQNQPQKSQDPFSEQDQILISGHVKNSLGI